VSFLIGEQIPFPRLSVWGSGGGANVPKYGIVDSTMPRYVGSYCIGNFQNSTRSREDDSMGERICKDKMEQGKEIKDKYLIPEMSKPSVAYA